MTRILDKINSPEDLRALHLSLDEQKQLASEIREELLNNVSKTGGHLASNLGVVELTIALHEVFDTPNDKLIFDVGHQSYVHKILTGRKDKMSTLRQYKGESGFPKSNESDYDAFNTGHSSTSISAALGMARAFKLKNMKNRAVAIIGDGSLTGGMALEALNDAGASRLDMIVILNDNEMSIEPNTGGLAMALTKMRIRHLYTDYNRKISNITRKIPIIGVPIVRLVSRLKHAIKEFIIPDMWFEEIGFKYLGPVNGHDLETLEEILYKAKDLSGPILIHVKTKKGKGYRLAEINPDRFHGVSPFDLKTGLNYAKKSRDYSKVFGETLLELAQTNGKICAITAAMTSGTGLSEFAKFYPERFFDVEIAEQHALTMAAGLAKEGMIPVVAMYSSFLQRAYDQLIHDICMQNLKVIICVDRAGIVGNDGETHQGLFDLSFRNIPNLTVMAPKNFDELSKMLEVAINDLNGPIMIRYPRGSEEFNYPSKIEDIKALKAEKIKDGDKLTILAIGKMVYKAIKLSELLKEDGIETNVINVRYLKPLDKKTIDEVIEKSDYVITLEDAYLKGGLYSAIAEEYINADIKLLGIGYDDKFVEHGSVSELEKANGLDIDSIYKRIKSFITLNTR